MAWLQAEQSSEVRGWKFKGGCRFRHTVDRGAVQNILHLIQTPLPCWSRRTETPWMFGFTPWMNIKLNKLSHLKGNICRVSKAHFDKQELVQEIEKVLAPDKETAVQKHLPPAKVFSVSPHGIQEPHWTIRRVPSHPTLSWLPRSVKALWTHEYICDPLQAFYISIYGLCLFKWRSCRALSCVVVFLLKNLVTEVTFTLDKSNS